MIRCVGRAVLAARAAWWAPAGIAMVVASLLGFCLVQVTGTDPRSPEVRSVLRSAGVATEDVAAVGLSISMLVVPVAIIVLAVVASAAVGSTTRDLARWRLAGASPGALALFVMTQILVACLFGGLVGGGLTAVAGPAASQALNGMITPVLGGVTVRPTGIAVFGAVIIPPFTALIAGLPAALRGSRVSAVRSVRGDEEPSRRIGILRRTISVLAVTILIAVVALTYAAPPTLERGQALSNGLGLGLLVLLVTAIGARALVPLIVRAVGVLLPSRGAIWPLARAAASARARVSGATVVALACGLAMLGIFSGMARTSQAIARALGSAEEYNLRDTYVICGAVGILTAVGGACVLALDAGDRSREIALLRAAGMTPRQILAKAGGEALLLLAATIAISGTATLLATGLIARSADVAGLPVRFVVPWVELGSGTLVTGFVLGATFLVPAVRALQVPVRPLLAAE